MVDCTKCDYYKNSKHYCPDRSLTSGDTKVCSYFREQTSDTCCECRFYRATVRAPYVCFCVRHKKYYNNIVTCFFHYRRKQMSDRIQIDVMVNGYAGTLADVSEETLIGMRNKSQPTVVPIKHGDYGYTAGLYLLRVFFKGPNDDHVKGYTIDGELTVRCDPNVPGTRDTYTITGNIFKDMQDGKFNCQKDSQ